MRRASAMARSKSKAGNGGKVVRPRFSKSKDNFNETEYFFKGAYRHVVPYQFAYEMFTKKRWVGKTVQGLFEEFGGYPNYYFTRSIRLGLITVNGTRVPPDTVLKGGEFIVHRAHRHEPAVLCAGDIEVLAESEDMLVVDKPSTIPVHPSGAYRYNSLLFILRVQRPDLGELHVTHRLDRLTSGVVLLGKSPQAAREITEAIAAGDTHKRYLARVSGNFLHAVHRLGGGELAAAAAAGTGTAAAAAGHGSGAGAPSAAAAACESPPPPPLWTQAVARGWVEVEQGGGGGEGRTRGGLLC